MLYIFIKIYIMYKNLFKDIIYLLIAAYLREKLEFDEATNFYLCSRYPD